MHNCHSPTSVTIKCIHIHYALTDSLMILLSSVRQYWIIGCCVILSLNAHHSFQIDLNILLVYSCFCCIFIYFLCSWSSNAMLYFYGKEDLVYGIKRDPNYKNKLVCYKSWKEILKFLDDEYEANFCWKKKQVITILWNSLLKFYLC